MKEIVERLHEKKQIELAKSILESAGYKVSKKMNEESTPSSSTGLEDWSSSKSELKSAISALKEDPENKELDRQLTKARKQYERITKEYLSKVDWSNTEFRTLAKNYDNETPEGFEGPCASISAGGSFGQRTEYVISPSGYVAQRTTNFLGDGGVHYKPVSDKVMDTVHQKMINGNYKAS